MAVRRDYVRNFQHLTPILGGFYFGSVDQERYSIQRLARKINGRVFGMPAHLSARSRQHALTDM